MTKTLYLMCPGETLFDAQGKNEGWSDSPLTERGWAQVTAAAQGFATRGIVPEAFAASTAERACDTLEAVARATTGRVPTYLRLKGLKELNFGSYEAADRFLNKRPPYGSFFVKFGGESEDTLRERMTQTLTQLVEQTDARTLLAVSHPLACAAFRSACTASADPVPLQPCSVLVFAFDEDARTFSLVESHTPTDPTSEASR